MIPVHACMPIFCGSHAMRCTFCMTCAYLLINSNTVTMNRKAMQWCRGRTLPVAHLKASRAYATAQSRMAMVGTRMLSSACAIVSPVSSGRPSVITTLNWIPCACKHSIVAPGHASAQCLTSLHCARPSSGIAATMASRHIPCRRRNCTQIHWLKG